MKQREIKFRVWDGVNYMSKPFTLLNIQNKRIEFSTKLPVMQYAGLKDKNGKEICEGDLLKETAPRGYKYRVFAVEGGFAVNTHQDDFNKENIIFYEGLSDRQNAGWIQSCEIIGNIYENPELLNPTK